MSLGGTFDPKGFAREIISTSWSDVFIYSAGYGAVRINARVDEIDPRDVFSPPPYIQFGEGLTIESAKIQLTEGGSLLINFGNGDIVEIVGALTFEHGLNSRLTPLRYVFPDDNVSISDLLDLANVQAVEHDLGAPITQYGDIENQNFDPASVGDVIRGGGGYDDIIYRRGYGEITVHVAPRWTD